MQRARRTTLLLAATTRCPAYLARSRWLHSKAWPPPALSAVRTRRFTLCFRNRLVRKRWPVTSIHATLLHRPSTEYQKTIFGEWTWYLPSFPTLNDASASAKVLVLRGSAR